MTRRIKRSSVKKINIEDGIYSHGLSDLKCGVDEVFYNFETHIGWLHMPAGHCCDMVGCINWFRKLDPRVCWIKTFRVEQQDTSYFLNGSGQWFAMLPDGRRSAAADIPLAITARAAQD
jgi:hypothetical protein